MRPVSSILKVIGTLLFFLVLGVVAILPTQPVAAGETNPISFRCGTVTSGTLSVGGQGNTFYFATIQNVPRGVKIVVSLTANSGNSLSILGQVAAGPNFDFDGSLQPGETIFTSYTPGSTQDVPVSASIGILIPAQNGVVAFGNGGAIQEAAYRVRADCGEETELPVFGLLCDWGTFARVFVDESGIAIYSVTSASRGILQVQATAARLASFPARPAQNTLVARSADGRFAIFILNTGEYQVNGGPDFEGKVRVCIFRTLAPTVHEKYEFFGGPPGSSNPFVDASGALPTGGTNGGGGGTCTVDTSSGRTYTVRRGDNLFRIALNNGTTVAQLARINCIANQTLVFVGQVLSLP